LSLLFSNIKLHAEKIFSAWELGKDRISNIEQAISNVQGRYRCRSAFFLSIDKIPSFIIGHSLLDIHYSLFMPYAFPPSTRQREKVSSV